MVLLENFYNELKLLTGEAPIRPFVCNGNPLETEVLIVGYNSAVSTSFWKYFNPENGFDEDKWKT